MDSLTRGLLDAMAPVTWSAVVVWLLRFTVIAAAGHVALAALSRASAASRHMVAIATLTTLLAAPIGTLLLPQWGLPILPRQSQAAAVAASRSQAHPRTIDATARSSAPAAGRLAIALPASHRIAVNTARSHSLPLNGPAAWTVVAALVAAVLMAKLVFGVIAAGRWTRSAAEVEDEAVLRELDRACETLAHWNSIELRVSSRIAIPVVFGLSRPVLLLPAAALSWPRERLRAVLLHEVAHVRRRDIVGHIAAGMATSLLWFHPLVWTLARAARRECERACDDAVLATGMRPSDYAEHLLAVARGAARGDRYDWAPAFSRRSNVEERLLFVLQSGVQRGPASRRMVAAILVAMLSLIPLTSLRLVAAGEALAKPAAASRGSERTKPLSAARWDDAAAKKSAAANDAAVAEVREVSSFEAAAGPSPEAVTESGDRIEVASNRSRSDDGEVSYDEAQRHYQAERYSEAGAAYARAAQTGYREGTAWYNAACSYSLAGRRAPAIEALENAIASGFERVDLLQGDSDLNAIRSDARFRRLIDEARDSDHGREERSAALRSWEKLRSSGSDDAGRFGSVGIDLLRTGEPEQAAEAFAAQARLAPSSSGIYNQACALAVAGHGDRALQSLERAILDGHGDGNDVAEDPDLVSLRDDPRFERLVTLASDLKLFRDRRDDDDRAAWRGEVPHFEEMAVRHRDVGRAWFNLGYARLRAEQAPGSLEAFRRALDLDYRPAITAYNLACASAQAGERDAAIEWLKRAESSGMELENHATWDRDLDPLRTDPRFRAMRERWMDRIADEKHADTMKWKDKDKNKIKEDSN